jgi:hypothetical protein
MLLCLSRRARRGRWPGTLALVLFASLATAGRASAHSYGAPSSIFRERRPPSCNGCHSGGAVPQVTVTAGARALAADDLSLVLTVTVTTPNGEPGAAGFDLRASRPGRPLGGHAQGAEAGRARRLLRALDARP